MKSALFSFLFLVTPLITYPCCGSKKAQQGEEETSYQAIEKLLAKLKDSKHLRNASEAEFIKIVFLTQVFNKQREEAIKSIEQTKRVTRIEVDDELDRFVALQAMRYKVPRKAQVQHITSPKKKTMHTYSVNLGIIPGFGENFMCQAVYSTYGNGSLNKKYMIHRVPYVVNNKIIDCELCITLPKQEEKKDDDDKPAIAFFQHTTNATEHIAPATSRPTPVSSISE